MRATAVPNSPQGFKGVLWGRATSATGLRVPCHWCKVPLTYESATVDHEPPMAEGGTRRQAVLACHACNQERGQATNDRINAKRKNRGRKKKRT